ncbi:hypothetical protein [Bradyrhizobium sp. CCBAU 11361]|uniref:hypothetical protein n=1 Tax=Bradyrhizobium sp. CCBAU 11361 TaxID=1630812 RepID=UPI003FA4BE70|nr:hypothetical protein [Bradyrhizobium sp. CCBAU 11361]
MWRTREKRDVLTNREHIIALERLDNGLVGSGVDSRWLCYGSVSGMRISKVLHPSRAFRIL